jgi:hypothetical protein
MFGFAKRKSRDVVISNANQKSPTMPVKNASGIITPIGSDKPQYG